MLLGIRGLRSWVASEAEIGTKTGPGRPNIIPRLLPQYVSYTFPRLPARPKSGMYRELLRLRNLYAIGRRPAATCSQYYKVEEQREFANSRPELIIVQQNPLYLTSSLIAMPNLRLLPVSCHCPYFPLSARVFPFCFL